MGGQEGSKGYLLQAMACVLKSIKEDNWVTVQLEPVTPNQKVDIIFEYENKERKVIQVKSSINSFTDTMVFKWLKELTNDYTSASSFELILLGICDKDAIKAKNCLNKLSVGNMDGETTTFYNKKLPSELKSMSGKLKVNILDNDTNLIEGNITNEFNRFLTDNGYNVNYYIVELIALSISYQYSKFSTRGGFWTRQKFINTVLEWVVYCFGEDINEKNARTKLDIKFYLPEMCDFKDKMQGLTIMELVGSSNLINSVKQNLVKILEEINNIKLSPRPKPAKEIEHNLYDKEIVAPGMTIRVLKEPTKLPNKLNINDYDFLHEYCELSDKVKEEIKGMTLSLLNVELEDAIFNVGSLKKRRDYSSISLSNQCCYTFEGTEIERHKYEVINTYRNELDKLDTIIEMFEYLNEYCFVPLVLRNVGSTYDESINVTIKIPKNIEILTSDKIKVPEEYFIEFLVYEDGFFEKLLKHITNSKVK